MTTHGNLSNEAPESGAQNAGQVEQVTEHPAILAWRGLLDPALALEAIHAGDDDPFDDYYGAASDLVTALQAAETALRRLAYPVHKPRSEEAALLQMEVEQTARDALERE